MSNNGSISLCAVRFSRLINGGVPDYSNVAGAWCAIAAGQLAWSEDIITGDDIAEKDACGQLQVVRKYQDIARRINITALDFLISDPRMVELATESPTITLGGEVIGYSSIARTGCSGVAPREGVCLEAWAENWACTDRNTTWPYTRFVFPKVFLNGGARTLQSGLSRVTMVGYGQPNALIGTGPAQDFPDDAVANDPSAFKHEFYDLALPDCGPDEEGVQSYLLLSSLSS